MKELNLAPTLDATESVISFVEQELSAVGTSPRLIARINIAVDEIYSNIARYSGAAKATVGCMAQDNMITLRFADDGLPYDPTAKGDPDLTLSAEAREIGGLGIFMVKKFMDSVDYEYKDGLNILTLCKESNSL